MVDFGAAVQQMQKGLQQLQRMVQQFQAAASKAINGTDAEVKALTERVVKLERGHRAVAAAVNVHAEALRARPQVRRAPQMPPRPARPTPPSQETVEAAPTVAEPSRPVRDDFYSGDGGDDAP